MHRLEACTTTVAVGRDAIGLYFSQAIIWVKEHPVLTRKDERGSGVKRMGFAWEQGGVQPQ